MTQYHRFNARVAAPRRTRGAALIVSLIMLVVMSLLGVTSMSTSRLEERMAGNARDRSYAFEAAETALIDGENYIGNDEVKSFDGSTTGLHPKPDSGHQLYQESDWAWDDDHTRLYDKATSNPLPRVSEQPRYYVEFLGEESSQNSLVVGFEAKGGVKFYRITARGVGASGSSAAIIQSVLAL